MDSGAGFQASAEWLNDVLDSIDTMILSIAPGTGEVLYANRAATELLGGPHPGARIRWLELVHPEDRARLRSRIASPLEEDPWSEEFRIVRGGEVRWIASKAVGIRSAGGALQRIDIVASDITEQRRQSEEKFRLLFDAAGDVIDIHRPDGPFLEVNQAAVERWGYSREELLRMRPEDIVSPAVREGMASRTEEIERRGTLIFETRNSGKDGRVIFGEVHANLIEYEGAPAILTVTRDTTERRLAEEKIRQAELRYRTLFEQAPVGIVIIDVATGAAVQCNESAHRQLGYSKEEFLRLRASDYVVEEAPQQLATRTRQILGDGEGRFDARHRTRHGEFRDVRVQMRVLELDRHRFFYCIYQDITEQKKGEQHEEILRKSLEESIQAIADTVEMRDPYTAGHQRRVGELAVSIAHEMGLPQEKIDGIRLAASIHDLGKIKVPAEILAKPGQLTEIEFMLMRTHAQAGYEILKDISFPWPIATIVWQHHERMDGSGYPRGLRGEEILLDSRIMAVADVVEAMASHRPYRASLGIEATLREIEGGRGTRYDAGVVDACVKLFREGKIAFPSPMHYMREA